MSFPLPLSALTRQPRSRQLQQASGSGALRVVRRLQALRALADTQSVQAGAERLHLGQHTLRDSRNALLLQGVLSLGSPRPPGRPNPCTPSPRRELAALSTAGPQATGYPSGGWHTPMRHDLVQRRCGAASPPPSLATLLHPLGFSSPQARVVSAHLPAATGLAWRRTTWPQMGHHARQRTALRLCGDAASWAHWGSLSDTWAPTGEHPAVPTRGQRKGSKVCGLLASCAGQFFSTGPEGRFHSESSVAFRRAGLSHTRRHVVVRQEGARSHTSQALQDFCQAQAARVTLEHWPSSSPDCHPRAHLGKKGKKRGHPCAGCS